MIIGSNVPLVVGQIYWGLTDHSRRMQEVPFVPLRASNEAEWRASLPPEAIPNDSVPALAYFYLVSVD